MRESLVVGQIIDRDDLLEFTFLHQTAEDHSANSSESIDCVVCHSSDGICAPELGRGN
jgi:hypothetical protein